MCVGLFVSLCDRYTAGAGRGHGLWISDVHQSDLTHLSCSVISADVQRAAGGDGGLGFGLQAPDHRQPAGGAGLPGVLDSGSGAPPGDGGHRGQR